MKDMEEAKYILGVKILQDCSKRLIVLSQEPCITKVLERFNMLNYMPVYTPIAKGESSTLKMCPNTKKNNKCPKFHIQVQ